MRKRRAARVAVVVGLLIGSLVWLVLAWRARDAAKREVSEAELAAVSAEGQVAVAAANPVPAPQEAPPPASVEVRATTPTLPQRSRMSLVIADLEALVRHHGLECTGSEMPAPTVPGAQTVIVAGRGTIASLCAFLAGIERNQDHVFVLHALTIEPDAGRGASFELVLTSHFAPGAAPR
ncbi:MAG: hypothetical protein HZB39_06370 [Planctomycetes bacterium]|nr:hypothetical protein [Planctomycetota bacterium]